MKNKYPISFYLEQEKVIKKKKLKLILKKELKKFIKEINK
jgi:hypothetical protein